MKAPNNTPWLFFSVFKMAVSELSFLDLQIINLMSTI